MRQSEKRGQQVQREARGLALLGRVVYQVLNLFLGRVLTEGAEDVAERA